MTPDATNQYKKRVYMKHEELDVQLDRIIEQYKIKSDVLNCLDSNKLAVIVNKIVKLESELVANVNDAFKIDLISVLYWKASKKAHWYEWNLYGEGDIRIAKIEQYRYFYTSIIFKTEMYKDYFEYEKNHTLIEAKNRILLELKENSTYAIPHSVNSINLI